MIYKLLIYKAMKKVKTLFVVLGSVLAINTFAQSGNDGVFKSSNDYKHPQSANKPASIYSENVEYVKIEKGSGNYKQQNSNVKTKPQGLVFKTKKKQQSWNALNNPANYKTQR
jgi:hypothetical protein